MKKRILFITLLLIATMVFTTVLLADSSPVVHILEGNSAVNGGCVGTGQGTSIPDNNPAGVCFPVNVSGPAGAVVNDVVVDVAVNHTWAGDLIFTLNSPDASSLNMLARPGVAGPGGAGAGDSSDLLASSPLSFSDAGATDAEQMGATLPNSTDVICQDDGLCDYSPNPDGHGGLPNFAGFAGETANGQWDFCVSDNAAQDLGDIGAITVSVACSAPPAPGIVFTKTVGTDPNVCATTDSITIPAGGGGTDVTYCYAMRNTGNITADLHTVVDDQLGTVLGPDFPAAVGPGAGAYFTVTTNVAATTVNSATWSTTDATGGNGVSASDTATVTQGTPTSVSVSSFASDQGAFSPIWLVSLFAIILGFGFVLRRRMIQE